VTLEFSELTIQCKSKKISGGLPELARPEHFQAELSERSNAGNAKKGDVQATSRDTNPTKYMEGLC